MQAGVIGIGIGVGAVAAGIGLGAATFGLARAITDRVTSRNAESAYSSPHGIAGTRTHSYGLAVIPAVAGFGAVAALVGAAGFGLTSSSPPRQRLLAAAGAVVGGALAGVVVGALVGSTAGPRRVQARHGFDINELAQHVMTTWDVTGDGELNVSETNGQRLEYLRRAPDTYTGHAYTSIEHFAKAADTDASGHVSYPELWAAFEKYDADHDGMLSFTDAEQGAFTAAGNEATLLTSINPI